MKLKPITSLVAVAALFATLALPQFIHAQRGGPQGPRVISPGVADGKITFRILAPKAEQVRLAAGDIPGGGQGRDMTKGTNGVWELTVDAAPGYYRYNFNIDGVAVIDPRNPATSESNNNTWSL